MENQYLNSDVRAVGGKSAADAWQKGYYLSTSIDGNIPRKFPEYQASPNQATGAQDFGVLASMEDKHRDLKGKIDFELPEDKSGANQGPYDWRQNHQNVYEVTENQEDDEKDEAANGGTSLKLIKFD